MGGGTEGALHYSEGCYPKDVRQAGETARLQRNKTTKTKLI